MALLPQFSVDHLRMRVQRDPIYGPDMNSGWFQWLDALLNAHPGGVIVTPGTRGTTHYVLPVDSNRVILDDPALGQSYLDYAPDAKPDEGIAATAPSEPLKPVAGSKVMLHIPATVDADGNFSYNVNSTTTGYFTQHSVEGWGGTVEVLSNPEPDPVQDAIEYFESDAVTIGNGPMSRYLLTLINAVKEARK